MQQMTGRTDGPVGLKGKPMSMDRRRFIAGAGAAATFTVIKPSLVRGFAANSRIKAGFVGLGGRGSLIADMMHRDHKGYEIVALADYFQGVVQEAGKRFGVDGRRCYSGLGGYGRMIDSGVDAVFLETPPCFFPEHSRAAVKAGCHVYMAKPVACDVWGSVQVAQLGKEASRNKQVFLVDFQVPTEPVNVEVVKRIEDGLLGKTGLLASIYTDEAFSDPPKTSNIESRLRHLVWVNDIDIGGGYLVNAGIHAIDAALWLAKSHPVSACGASRVLRSEPHGDTADIYSVTYRFEDGLILNHRGEHVRNTHGFACSCMAFGEHGHGQIDYEGSAWIRGNKGGYKGGAVGNLYVNGITRNLSRFEKNVREGICDNETVQQGVRSTLATILGREAAAQKTELTWDSMIRENRRIEPDLSGLKN